MKYDYADSFSWGLALVRINGKYGYINKSQDEIIPCIYEDARSFEQGRAKVELNGERFQIDYRGVKKRIGWD